MLKTPELAIPRSRKVTTVCNGRREVWTDYADLYNRLLSSKEIYDIPVEFYSVEIKYFNGSPVLQRFSSIKAAFIDTTRKNYAYVVDKFVADNITNFLSINMLVIPISPILFLYMKVMSNYIL